MRPATTRSRNNGLVAAAAIAVIIAAILLIGILVTTSITAHNSETSSSSSDSGCDKHGYSVPFVCGFNPGATVRILPGFYATSVMIHNPSSRNVDFKKKISLTFPPPNQAAGFVSEEISDSLGECQALMVDCEEILGEFVSGFPGQLPPYIIGVFSVTSEKTLQVSQEQTVNGFTFPQDEVASGIQKKKDESPSGIQKRNGPPPSPPPPPTPIIGSGAPSVSQLQIGGHCV